MIDQVYLEAVTTVAAAAAAFLVSHHIVSRKSIENKLMTASAAVQAAEEIFPLVAGSEKFAYAIKQLQDATGVSLEEAEMLINAAVTGLRANGVKS